MDDDLDPKEGVLKPLTNEGDGGNDSSEDENVLDWTRVSYAPPRIRRDLLPSDRFVDVRMLLSRLLFPRREKRISSLFLGVALVSRSSP